MSSQYFAFESTVDHMPNSSREDNLFNAVLAGELSELGVNGDDDHSWLSELERDGIYSPRFDHQEVPLYEHFPHSYGEHHVETMQDQGSASDSISTMLYNATYPPTHDYAVGLGARTPRVVQSVCPPSLLCPDSSSRPPSVYSFYPPPPLSLDSPVSTLIPSEFLQERYMFNDYSWDATWSRSSLSDDRDVSMDRQNPSIPEMYSTAPPIGEGELDFRTDTILNGETVSLSGSDLHRDYAGTIATGTPPPCSPSVSRMTDAADGTGVPVVFPWQVSLWTSTEFLLTLPSVLRDIRKPHIVLS
ncbi:uncharacterized protein ARMOST_12221 [Armillaria ostoyae]|uniref:Uncharacterized protein n=1 Tax=Armillaria ostoyae TaxID=47428 RepID=A0A284RJC1_ARMOS|nr:uncharacterized protein ARMOST_12221 [Armillaria ostoyae]